MSARRRLDLSLDDDFVAKSVGRRDDGVESVPTPGGSLPRRFISSSVTACIKSNSPSLKCLTALRRFLGKVRHDVALFCLQALRQRLASLTRRKHLGPHRSRTGRALLARQGRVPWRNHGAANVRRQYLFDDPTNFCNTLRSFLFCWRRFR